MGKIRVLLAKEKLSSDGATAVLLNIAKELKEEVQFDILLYSEEGNDWEWKFEELGCDIYYREAKNHNPIARRIHRLKLYSKFFKENTYNIIHINTDTVEKYDILLCAWLRGVKKRIYHSHNSRTEDEGPLMKIPGYKRMLKFFIAKVSTDLLACSKEAAEWMFPSKYLDRVKMIKNGIYTERFQYNSAYRSNIREIYGLENCFVIGCVARFVEQKNHKFLIDIFAEIAKEEKDARLMLIGDGELKGDIQKKVKDLEIEDDVIFVGTVDNVEEYLSAMDIYIMPSLFEGLSLVFIEAQTAGLYCLASTSISPETKVCERMEFISLTESPDFWKERALSNEAKVSSATREVAWKDVVSAGFDIKDASHELLEVYKQV